MFTKLLVRDDETDATFVKDIYLPVPKYELGEIVGFLSHLQDRGNPHDEGVITGYHILVKHDPIKSTFSTSIEYSIDDGTFSIDEDEIEYSYGTDDKAFTMVPIS